MAIIQYTAIVNQLRGKLNGSQFNKGRTSYTLQSKASQTKQVKGNQSAARSEFAFVQRSWKALPPSTKQAWAQVAANNPDTDRFGQPVTLSGYNKYIQCVLRSRTTGWMPIDPPITSPAPAFSFSALSVSNLAFSQSSNGNVSASGTISISSPEMSTDFVISAYMSYPYSAGITQYYNTHVKMWNERSNLNMVIQFDEDIAGRYPMPQAGQIVEFKFIVIWLGNGVKVQEQVVKYQL